MAGLIATGAAHNRNGLDTPYPLPFACRPSHLWTMIETMLWTRYVVTVVVTVHL